VSHAKIDKFARMANQIGDYFSIQPPEQAAAGVAIHIRKYWTPKMIGEALQASQQGRFELNATAAAGFAILQKEFASAA